MLLWLQLFLLSAGITARLIIPAATCGSGVNLLLVIFIWLALLVHLLDKPRLSAPEPTPILPSALKFLLGLFAAFIIASFVNAPYKFGAFQYLSAWISDIVLFYLVYSLCVMDAKYINTLLSVFLATGLMVVGYGLYQNVWELKDLAGQIQQNPSLLDVIPTELQGGTLARAAAGEPFATFIYQNSFGAFLALIIPILIITIFVRRNTNGTNSTNHTNMPFWKYLISIVIVLLSLFVLIQTGSKGAMVALILGVGLTGIIYYFSGVPSVKRGFRGVLLLIGVLIGLILLGFIIHSQMSDSLNVRLGYWDATVKIIQDNPITGVGLNQFSNSYLYYKSAEAGEVLKAHNDYLQMASELGILALVFFLAIWFIILKSIFRPARQNCHAEPEGTAPSELVSASPETLNRVRDVTFSVQGDREKKNLTLPYILGAAFAFLLSELFQTPLIALDIPLLPTIIVFALWLGAFRIFYGYLTRCYCEESETTKQSNNNEIATWRCGSTRNDSVGMEWLRIGLFAGLLAFLIHCLADFNFYVQGLSMSAWFIGALFLSMAKIDIIPIVSWTINKVVNWLAIILVVGIIGILSVLAMRFISYDPFAFLKDVKQQSGEPVFTVSYSSSTWNPYAVEPKLTMAWWHHSHVDFSNDSIEPRCLKYISEAISLNPLAPMLYNQQGRLYLEHAEQERQKGNNKVVDAYERRAKHSFRIVKELHPTYNDNKK